MASELGVWAGLNAARGAVGEAEMPVMKPLVLEGMGGGQDATRFADAMLQAVRGVDDKSREAGDRMAAVDAGRSDDLVGAMLASQEASLSFSMLMQVRNKVVGAMDELIKLQL